MIFLKLKPSPENITEGSVADRHFEATKSLMTALGGLLQASSDSTISLELSCKDSVTNYIVGAPSDLLQAVTHQIYAAFPSCNLEQMDEWSVFNISGEMAGAAVQFTPPEGDLRSERFNGTGPLQPILEVLGGVPASQRLSVALLLTSSGKHESLAQKAIGAVHDGLVQATRDLILGSSKGPNKSLPEEDDKTKSAPFKANLRVIALANTAKDAEDLVHRAAGAYHGLSIPGKTKIRYQIPKHLDRWMEPALLRIPDQKTAFWLTDTEAANLYHTPLRPRTLTTLETVGSTRLPIPDTLSREGLTIGYGAYRDTRIPIRMSAADRLRHTYLIGQTGTGKSTLLQSTILQDMEAGEGCCYIDPHGDGIDWLLPRIPKHRAADVVLFDPSDPEAILGLNLLEWHTQAERDLLIQELIMMFYKLFDPNRTGLIGPQFEHWLRNAALTITEPAIRGTLVDIPRLFTDDAFKDAALARSDHWAVKDFWQNQMAQTASFHKSEMLNYFTSKFGSFLGNSVMHKILSQRNSAFDMRTLMDRRKILLVNLSKGKLGSLNAQLLGSLIITKIQMAAMSRADVPPEQRPPFYAYIDEFQNIVTDSFAQMLAEIRKYGVGLVLAHQYVDQLPDSIKQAITGNVGTLMAFRLGHADAKWLAPHFAPLTAEDLTNVAPFHYHLRTLASGQLTTPFTVMSPQIIMDPQPALEQALRTRVREYVASISSLPA
jgi:hypothetical protein